MRGARPKPSSGRSLRRLPRRGGGLADVVRTRIYVTDISLWPAVAAAHSAAFAAIRPAATMVEVARLIHPDMLVEIEAEAVLPAPPP